MLIEWGVGLFTTVLIYGVLINRSGAEMLENLQSVPPTIGCPEYFICTRQRKRNGHCGGAFFLELSPIVFGNLFPVLLSYLEGL